MGESETCDAKFTWYWYFLVSALEESERNDDHDKHYDGSREMQALLKDALTRLETAMDRTLLTELRQSHGRKVAGRRWVELVDRLESLEHSSEAFESQETALRLAQTRQTGDELSAMRKELGALEQELGRGEMARIRDMQSLRLLHCGTASLRAQEWTPEKKRDEDSRLMRDVDEFLAGTGKTH